MEWVKSRYKLLPLAGVILLLLFAAACWYCFFGLHYDAKFHRRMLFVAILFTFFSFFAVLMYLKDIPVITVSDTGLFFHYIAGSDKWIGWEDVKEIKPIDVSATGIGGDGSTIRLADGSSLFISAANYSNMQSIRQSLQDRISKQKAGVADPILPVTRPAILVDTLVVYAGNPWLSVNTITFFLSSIPVITALILSGSEGYIFLSITVVAFLYYGWRMFYFQLSGDSIIIRNHYWVWYRKNYLIEDINTCILEPKTKGTSSALRIICRDFSSKSYKAGSLREKHWQALLDEIKLLKIKTIIEIRY